MSTSLQPPTEKKICFKDHCLKVVMWAALIVGFALICVGLPLVAFQM